MDPKDPQQPNPSDNEADDDYNPAWPQRPSQPRAGGLDPNGSPRARSSQPSPNTPPKAETVSPWTATPTSYTPDADTQMDPNATNRIPHVDRFATGRPPTSNATPPTPNRPKPTPPQSAIEETRIASAADLPYGRGYSAAEDATLVYTPAQRPQPNPKSKIQNPKSRNLDLDSGYLDAGGDARQSGRDGKVRRKPRFMWLLWSLLGIFALALVGVVAFTLAWQGQYAGKIYAGVTVLDTSLGGKTPEEAKRLLQDKVKAFTEQPLVLAWQAKEWRPRADQIGLQVDVDFTVEEAMRVGRQGNIVGDVSQQWLAAQTGYNIPLLVQLNEPAMQNYLTSTVVPETDQALFEGDVRLDGTRVVALPGKEGRQLRQYDTIIAIRDSLAKLESGKVELPVEITQPTVSAGEVQYIEGLLSIRISSPITATAPGKVFSLDPEALIRFTTIERNPDREADRHLTLGWKDNELATLADGWAEDARRPAQNARFAWRDGQVAVLSESIDGFETTPDAVVSSIKQHADLGDARVYEIPGKVITPTVSSKDLGNIGIREKLGTGTSTFKGSSPERATNIRVAADLINGSVVPPGGDFSFLDAVGGIDEEHGFVEGYVIAAERTQKGVGGGVCQVSTTAFRAAFWSGLDLTERNQHSYRVSWYEAGGEPVGFDAAVFDPGVDLKWINNTSGFLLIEAVTGADSVTVNIYGTKIANEVKLEGPVITNRVPPPPDVYEVDSRLPPGTKKQVETARGGLDTAVTRRITLANGEVQTEAFRSSYRAWPNWYVVASASQIPGNKAAPAASPTPNP